MDINRLNLREAVDLPITKRQGKQNMHLRERYQSPLLLSHCKTGGNLTAVLHNQEEFYV